jgi:mannose-6-phosphate isomerase-like protein (cupin superfamily)
MIKTSLLETKQLPAIYNEISSDKSEIRFLHRMKGGSVVHCTLPPSTTSFAVSLETTEEVWYFLQGFGQVWRKIGQTEEIVDVREGTSLTIPTGTHFQFRNTGWQPLCFICITMPPWPGEQENQRVAGYW